MTRAKRSGPKGAGKILLDFEGDGRPNVVLTAFEVRMAYRTLYDEKRRARASPHRETEIERSLAEAGVPQDG